MATLLDELKSPDERTRLRAIYQLGILGDISALDALQQIAENDPIPELQTVAKASISYLQQSQQFDPETDVKADAIFAENFKQFLGKSERFSLDDIAVPANTEADSTTENPKQGTYNPDGSRTEVVGTYEMFWDCEFCGTKKLLGVTHRFCPNCGSAQNPNARYFPAPGEEVELKNHIFYGVDVICPACSTPNSANASYCRSCGADLSSGEKAQLRPTQIEGVGEGLHEEHRDLVKEKWEAQQTPIVSEQSKPSIWANKRVRVGGCVSTLVLTVVSIFGVFFMRIHEDAIIASHSWVRAYEIEEYKAVRETRDCPAPSGAYNIRSVAETRSRQVPDGQVCHEECSNQRVDQGDGSFRNERVCNDVCETKYRTEHYTVQVCTYDINRWVDIDEEKDATWAIAEGNGINPIWPDVETRVPSCDNAPRTLGQECWESRQETYILHLQRENGKEATCDLDTMDSWLVYKDNQKVRVAFTIFSRARGIALCDEMEVIE